MERGHEAPPLTVEVFLAEDDDGHAVLAEATLKAAGVQGPIRHLRTGQETIDALADERSRAACDGDHPTLLLLDLYMPDGDGFDVLRWLRTNPIPGRFRIVAVSSTDDPVVVDLCRRLGTQTFLTKPLTVPMILTMLRQLGLCEPVNGADAASSSNPCVASLPSRHRC